MGKESCGQIMKSFLLCFTGVSGSGKSTLAKSVCLALKKQGRACDILDGDITRNEIGELFGYSYEGRMNMNKVNRVIARYLLNNGINVIMAIVAPYDTMRTEMREYFGDSYVQIFLNCTYEVCAKRDVKGYYRKQKEGEMENLSGAGDVYEIPMDSEIEINTDGESVEESTEKIVQYLVKNILSERD